jgi:RNA polymerase sigma factor (sigma-70 family)
MGDAAEGADDRELVERARAGSREAFDRLAERHRPMAFRLAQRLTGNEEAARDLTQEALIQAFLSLERLRDPRRFRAWLYGIVVNVCRAHLRAARSVQSWEELAGGAYRGPEIPEPEPGPAELAEQSELERTVFDAVIRLSPEDCAATLWFYYGQMSLREIGERLGIPEARTKVRLHRARRRLRKWLIPLYPELESALTWRAERSRPMIPVQVAEVFRLVESDECVVVLLDEPCRRVLPMWIDLSTAFEIALPLRGAATPRPTTGKLMLRLLSAAEARVEEVRIEALRDGIFFSTVRVAGTGGSREVDARPSDAVALALNAGRPVLVAPDVMEKAAIPLPEAGGGAADFSGRAARAIEDWIASTPEVPALFEAKGMPLARGCLAPLTFTPQRPLAEEVPPLA